MNIISKIEYERKNKSRVNIYVNGEFCMAAPVSAVYELSLSRGMELNDELKGKLAEYDEREGARLKALRILARSYPSEKTLSYKLKKDFSEDVSDEILDSMKSIGMVDDSVLAKRIIRDGIEVKRVGRNRIKETLIRKGVPAEVYEPYLGEIDREVEYDNALYQAHKKLGDRNLSELDERALYKLRGSILSSLSYKGFDYDICRRACDEAMNIGGSEW